MISWGHSSLSQRPGRKLLPQDMLSLNPRSPGLIPPPGFFSGPPREKALLFSTIAPVYPVLVGPPTSSDTLLLVILAQQNERKGRGSRRLFWIVWSWKVFLKR